MGEGNVKNMILTNSFENYLMFSKISDIKYSPKIEKGHAGYVFDVWDFFNYDVSEFDNSKILLIDNKGEDWDYLKRQDELIEKIISNKNIYYLSQRNILDIQSDRVLQGQTYLSLIYYFYLMNDDLWAHPPLPNFENKYKEYDFICYRGLQHSDTNYHIDQKKWRDDILDNIDFKDKTLYTPTTFKDIDVYNDWDYKKNWGAYNWYSLLESERAYIKLVFETLPSDYNNIEKIGFLTEKTTKCFLHTQPYFLFLPEYLKKQLENIGFEFPTETVENVCKSNTKFWTEFNKHIFVNNKKTFQNLISNGKYLDFYKNVFKNTNII